MKYLVMFVLAQPEQLDPIVEAWHGAGAEDVTVFQSKNLAQIADRCRRDDLPLFPSLSDIFENEEFDHYTLFTVAADEEQVDQLTALVEQHIGDLDRVGNGMLVALPVARIKGFHQRAHG